MSAVSTKPVVSIISLTYNQEKYVRECFEGFLMQQTSFPFEVLVYDDASTDTTPEIIRQYADKYPDIFKPTLYKENNYSRGLGYVGLYDGIKNAQGKYVAYCEGDDYWTDPLKLQKQVDFLDSHPEYEICANEIRIKNDRYKHLDGLLFSQFCNNLFVSTTKKHYSFEDALTGNIFHVSSLVYRNFDVVLPDWIHRVSAFDMVFYMILAKEGDMFVMPEVMGVYRSHSQSLTNTQSGYTSPIAFYELSLNILRLMNRFWDRQYQDKIYPIISRYYVECMMECLHKRNMDKKKAKKMARMAWCYDKRTASKYVTKGLFNKFFGRFYGKVK